MNPILVVDDDSDFCAALSAFLESEGFRTICAADAREGLRLAKTHLPAIVIMDIVMNEPTEGLFAVREMRHSPELLHVPVFAVTSLFARTDLAVPREPGWMACDELFTKPVDLEAMLEKIRQYVPAQGGVR